MTPYTIAPVAIQDMLDIFTYIAEDNFKAAETLESDFYEAFALLAEHPRMGHARPDLTSESCLFWPVRRRYFVIYEDTDPLTVLRVVNAYRDITILL